MKTTVEIPDDLFRKAKATAAIQGRSLKDLITEGLRTVLNEPEEEPLSGKERLTLHDRMKDVCGIGNEPVPPDLLTNPRHMDGFGG